MNLITALANKLFSTKNHEVDNKLPRNMSGETAWASDYGMYSQNIPIYNPDDLVVRHGLSKYSEIMTDEQVKSVVRFRRAAITSRSYDFNFSEDAVEQLSESERQFRKRLCWSMLSAIPGSFNDTLNGILSAYYNGFSLTEKVFKLFEYDNRQWVGISKLALRPADTMELYSDQHGNLTRIVQKVSTKDIELDPQKFIHFVQNPDIDELYGRSELRECYRSWFSKDVAIKNQNLFGARLAGGFIWAELDENYSITPGSAEELALRASMRGIQTKSSIILPKGVTLHVEMPKSSNFFEGKIAQEDKAIAKALLVPNLLGITEQGNTGSYSQSQTQFEAFMWTLDSDVNKLQEVLNEQLFSQLHDLNFGDGLYPRFEFKPLSQTAKMEIAKVWLSLVQGNAVTNSENDEDWVRDLLGAPPRVDDQGDDETGDTDQEGDDTEVDDTGDDGTETGDVETDLDETIVGESVAKVTAMSRAIKRVNFAEIDRKADVITYQRTDELSERFEQAVENILQSLPESSATIKDVSQTSFKSSDLKAMQKIVSSTLRDAWDVGFQQASLEIKRAERQANVIKEKMSANHINMAALDKSAAAYFEAQSYAIAGELSNQAVKIIRQEMLNGVRYSKSIDEVRKSIYERLASAGLISQPTAEAANVGLGLKNSKHTIDTAIRTASFNAINEARYQYYTDAALDGFVVALEYSAVLDSRTTNICNELGSPTSPHVHSTSWPGWDVFRPPNHYDCRSLLIPVTQLDEWEESPEPQTMPQEGFK